MDNKDKDYIQDIDWANLSDSQFEEYVSQGTIDGKAVEGSTSRSNYETNLGDTSNNQNTNIHSNDYYKNFYDTVTSFRANGKDMHIDDPNELVRLARQGLGYHKKMEKLKDAKVIYTTLEQNKVTKDQLEVLLDAVSGNKAAIKKILEDNKIDPYELLDNYDFNGQYTPTSKLADPVAVAFNDKVEELKDNPDGLEVLKYVDKLDDRSVNTIYSNPALFDLLLEAKEQGYFDQAVNEAKNIKSTDPFASTTKSELELFGDAVRQIKARQIATSPVVQQQPTQGYMQQHQYQPEPRQLMQPNEQDRYLAQTVVQEPVEPEIRRLPQTDNRSQATNPSNRVASSTGYQYSENLNAIDWSSLSDEEFEKYASQFEDKY